MNSSQMSPSGCEADTFFGERLRHPSPFTQAILIFIILANILTVPFTTVLNALVMIAVKVKSRLRAHKSNILLAMLSLTDFTVGILVQPLFIASLIMFLFDEPSGYCIVPVVKTLIVGLAHTSLYHLTLISGERYLAMKHPFAYSTLVTEARLLVASALAWLLSVILPILTSFDLNILGIYVGNTMTVLSIVVIAFCHVTVYRETRRHQQQIAVQQVTQEAKEQFKRDKKAFILTSIILEMLLLCFIPFAVFTIVAVRYRSEITLETVHIFSYLAISMLLLNSLINPIIYSVRMRQFRIAFVELVYKTVNIVEAEEIEVRLFGVPNAVVRLQAVQELKREDQRNVEQLNVNNNDNRSDDALPQHVNYVVEQPYNNSHSYCVRYRHSI